MVDSAVSGNPPTKQPNKTMKPKAGLCEKLKGASVLNLRNPRLPAYDFYGKPQIFLSANKINVRHWEPPSADRAQP